MPEVTALPLRARLEAATAHAIAQGALAPITTTTQPLNDADIPFTLRIAQNLNRKHAAAKTRPKDFNPFLPHDPDLWVADPPPAHRALLNKFPVLDHHLLVVTRDFEHQDTPLTGADFEALAHCMAQVPGLAFYNGGRVAGASQPHKHLQLAPDLVPPIQQAALSLPDTPGSTAALPFPHQGCRLPESISPAELHALYTTLHTNLTAPGYNLLLTAEWFLFVPRSEEHFATASFNALAFAGLFFARNETEAALLEATPPSAILPTLCPAPRP